MYITKRITALVIICTMLTMLLPAVSAATPSPSPAPTSTAVPTETSAAMVPLSFNDVTPESSYYFAIMNLAVKGIITGYPDGSFNPGGQITRAEFAKIICLAYNENIDNILPLVTAKPFNDVETGHWAAPYIQMAATLGIINGMGDGTFHPEEAVSMEQSVKMIIAMLGYNEIAKTLGGYPEGYYAIANQHLMLKGVKGGNRDSAVRQDVAQMIFNSFDITRQVSVTTSVGSQVSTYVGGGGGGGGGHKNDDPKMKPINGVLQGSKAVNLVDEVNSIREDSVKIDGELYKIGRAITPENAELYTGSKVRFTFTQESSLDDKVLTSVQKIDSGALLIPEILSDDIVKFENNTLYYWKNGKIVGVSIRPQYVWYNGQPILNMTSLDPTLIPTNGKIKLSDSDTDGTYDAVVIIKK